MTHRDELNAMSNAKFGAWLFDLIDVVDNERNCWRCPIPWFFCKERIKAAGLGEDDAIPCPDIIADWLRAEAE